MPYELPVIPFLKLKFILAAQRNCHLPRIKGSMLRGAFGHALRHTVCVTKSSQTCEVCKLRQQCIYTRWFETYIAGEPPPFLKWLQTAPNPFIIDAFDLKTDFKEGETFAFTMTLPGRAYENYPYIIFSVASMAGEGLSAYRYPFRLDKVFWYKQPASDALHGEPEERLLYNGDTQCLCEPAYPATISGNGAFASPLTLQFLTPARLKFGDKYDMNFNFRMLVFKMLRRVLELAHFHAPGSNPDWQFNHYLAQANAVQITRRNLTREDWRRYSNRQKTEIDMIGFIGDIRLEGEVQPFAGLIHLSELLHIGKGTSVGMGKVRMRGTV